MSNLLYVTKAITACHLNPLLIIKYFYVDKKFRSLLDTDSYANILSVIDDVSKDIYTIEIGYTKSIEIILNAIKNNKIKITYKKLIISYTYWLLYKLSIIPFYILSALHFIILLIESLLHKLTSILYTKIIVELYKKI